MSETALEEQLKNTFVNALFLDIEPSSIENDHDLAEYGFDSFYKLVFLSAIEEEYNIHLEPSDLPADALKTINNVAALVRSKQA